MANTTYQEKKTAQKHGSYSGSSPFFMNIPEFQHLKPIDSYIHIRDMQRTMNFRVPRRGREFRHELTEEE